MPTAGSLYDAVAANDQKTVRRLLESGCCCVNGGDDQTGYTPLLVASENGYLEIARLLLEQGAEVNQQYVREFDSDESFAVHQQQGYSLTLAIGNGHAQVVQLLLEKGADPNTIKWNYDGEWNYRLTPLLLALYEDSFEIAELLLRFGADLHGECLIRGNAYTPLSLAVEKKKAAWVTFLRKHGTDSGNANLLA